jgi:MoaA/NifB/PqqE/SkfB family radical SAM enzyme
MHEPCAFDALHAAEIDTVLFEATSNCNLRCTYCRVSAPTYAGEDFDFSRVERLADQMVAANVRSAQISGHGETTMLAHWQDYCRVFLDRGIAVRITSNFAKVFTDEEIKVLARMQDITISIDTIDRALLRSIRRRVDLRTILYNMQRVRLASMTLHGREPCFNWQCTISDRVVAGLPAWVEMGLLNGVRTFTLCNLIEHKDLPEVLARENAPLVRHVATMEFEPLIAACQSIQNAVVRARGAGATFIIQPGTMEGINHRLRMLGAKERMEFSSTMFTPDTDRNADPRLAVTSSAEAHLAAPEIAASDDLALAHDVDGGQSQTLNSQPRAGQTRDCLDPWNLPFLRANGDLWPCPWFYSPLGNVHAEPFDKLMNGSELRKLRHELLTGDLRVACRQCPSRGITAPALLLERLKREVRIPRDPEGGVSEGNRSRLRRFGLPNGVAHVLARIAGRTTPKQPQP